MPSRKVQSQGSHISDILWPTTRPCTCPFRFFFGIKTTKKMGLGTTPTYNINYKIKCNT